MTERYAVYYAPPSDSRLGRLAASWLGRDAETGETVARPDVPLRAGDIDRITASPRHYGFHGTLKPPFVLAEGCSPDDFMDAVSRLAGMLAPAPVPGLSVREISHFVALMPEEPADALDALAARVVTELDAFRAPPQSAELERRRRAGLKDRQEALLVRWGYPYVLDEFRIHMTLTGPLDEDERARIVPVLRSLFAPVAGDLVVDSLSVFRDPGDGGPFRLVARFPLEGSQ